MLGSSVRYVVFRVVIVVSFPFRYIQAEVSDSKCTGSRTFYETCSLNYEMMSLWCDLTNFSSIPHPKHPLIETQAPVERTKEIYLNGSCVAKLDAAILRQYPYLEYFNCDDNEISAVGDKTFEGNSNLKTLILSGNKISLMDDDAFTGLSRLRVLDLKGNLLIELTEHVFDELVGLRTLDVSDNRLTAIHPRAFLVLQNLREIYLSGNLLTSVSSYQFSSMLELRVLDLHSNALSSMGGSTFHSNTHLSTVDISSNNISCLPKTIFQWSGDISLVKLNNNKLTKPKPEWFRGMLRRNRRDDVDANLLSGNQWSCGCDSFLYRYFLVNDVQHRFWRNRLDIVCSSPSDQHEKRITSIPDDFYNECPINTNKECDDEDDVDPPITPPMHIHKSSSAIAGVETTISEIKSSLAVVPMTAKQNTRDVSAIKEEPPEKHYPIIIGVLVAIIAIIIIAVSLILYKFKCKPLKKANETSSPEESSLTSRDSSDEGFYEQPPPPSDITTSHQCVRTVSELSQSSNDRAYRCRTTSGLDSSTNMRYSKLSNDVFVDDTNSQESVDINTAPKTLLGQERCSRHRSYDSGTYSNPEESPFDICLGTIPEAPNSLSDHTYHEIMTSPEASILSQTTSSSFAEPAFVTNSNLPDCASEYLRPCSISGS